MQTLVKAVYLFIYFQIFDHKKYRYDTRSALKKVCSFHSDLMDIVVCSLYCDSTLDFKKIAVYHNLCILLSMVSPDSCRYTVLCSHSVTAACSFQQKQ